MDNTFEEIKKRWAATTPGPWWWRAPDERSIELMGMGTSWLLVMDFVRSGKYDAVPRFSDRLGNKGGIMHKATDVDLALFPDAVAIEHSKADVDYLIAEVERLQAEVKKLQLAFSQANPYWWGAGDVVYCDWCDGEGNSPGEVQHKDGCVWKWARSATQESEERNG